MFLKFSNLGLLKLLKGVFFSLSISLALLLIFSGVFAIFGANGLILNATQILIRLVAVGVCAYFYSNGQHGILRGAVSGLVTFLLLTLITMAITGGITGGKIWLSALFSVIFGIIFGIIFANLKKSANNS